MKIFFSYKQVTNKNASSGSGTGDNYENSPKKWPWLELFDKYFFHRNNVNSPLTVDTATTDFVAAATKARAFGPSDESVNEELNESKSRKVVEIDDDNQDC